MKSVSIILSTYNGEEYLRELCDSLINQTYKNIKVYIRDDGSTDSTVEIIKEYCSTSYEGISFHYIEDDLGNLRTYRSMFHILKRVPESDYYGFCDQDDIWLENKVEDAVRMMNEKDNNQPVLYASNYYVCDQQLNTLGEGKKAEDFTKMNVGRSFFNYGAGLGQGFTLFFNHVLKELAFDIDTDTIRGHDVWLWAVIVGNRGTYIFNDDCTALYRRHDKTVTATGKGFISMWKARWRMFNDKVFFHSVVDAIVAYKRYYYDKMKKKEDRDFLELFGNREFYQKKRLKKAFYKHRLKPKFIEELALRWAFLVGRA